MYFKARVYYPGSHVNHDHIDEKVKYSQGQNGDGQRENDQDGFYDSIQKRKDNGKNEGLKISINLDAGNEKGGNEYGNGRNEHVDQKFHIRFLLIAGLKSISKTN